VAALQTFGIDRVMFSVDCAPAVKRRAFVDRTRLAPAEADPRKRGMRYWR
jgi:hypothetical protein